MDKLYFYCTDFIINLANMFGLSYYEINAFLFCFLFPILAILLFLIFIFQKIKLNRLKRNTLNGILIVMSFSFLTSCSNSKTQIQSKDVGMTWKNINQPRVYFFNDFVVEGKRIYGVTRSINR